MLKFLHFNVVFWKKWRILFLFFWFHCNHGFNGFAINSDPAVLRSSFSQRDCSGICIQALEDNFVSPFDFVKDGSLEILSSARLLLAAGNHGASLQFWITAYLKAVRLNFPNVRSPKSFPEMTNQTQWYMCAGFPQSSKVECSCEIILSIRGIKSGKRIPVIYMEKYLRVPRPKNINSSRLFSYLRMHLANGSTK